ncbi:MAG TPA: hypothetical protein G4O01_03405 [Dehalococcoidia bacterium]|jgi:hypothetical protein|nr:hypothetical protein [Dehalococcoidia bacterium]
MRLGTIALAPFAGHLRLWRTCGGVAILLLIGTLLAPSAAVAADNTSAELTQCLTCHQVKLESHDRLGLKNEACWACHDKNDMTKLSLAGGGSISRASSSHLCGQCHQKRFKAWSEGTHGIPGTVAAVPCTACHDPHQPQIVLTGITKPHPAPASAPPSPPVDAMVIVGITVVLMTGASIIMARQRPEWWTG